MGNTEIERLAQDIYNKHKKALDIIFENKTDISLKIREHLENRIKENGLELDQCSKTAIRFVSKHIDELIPKKGESWTNTNRMLLFEFSNRPGVLVLKLAIGPGDQEIRVKLREVALKDKELFGLANRTLGEKWHSIYKKDIFQNTKIINSDSINEEELLDIIDNAFKNFISNDLPAIEEHFKIHLNDIR